MIRHLANWCRPMFETDGQPNPKAIGELVVGIAWTLYMLRQQPDSVEMWTAYAAVMLGWSTVNTAMDRFAPRRQPPPVKMEANSP